VVVRGNGGDRYSCGCHSFSGCEFAWKVKAFYCVLGFGGVFLRKSRVFVIKVNIWDSHAGSQKPNFYKNTWLQHAKTAKTPFSAIGVRKSWINLATKSSNTAVPAVMRYSRKKLINQFLKCRGLSSVPHYSGNRCKFLLD
jgi:hypothetical protein